MTTRFKSPPAAKGQAAEFAYRRLREEIIRRLEPGENLNEEYLTAIGLSRTPAREALVRLASDGLVEILPNRGARVATLGWAEVRDHLESLEVIQRLVTRLAAIRRKDNDLELIRHELELFEKAVQDRDGFYLTEANLRFHVAIAAACQNATFERCYRQILTQGMRIDRHAMFVESFPREDDYIVHLGKIVAEHRQIFVAIEAGDADAADRIALAHAQLAKARIVEALTANLSHVLEIDFAGLLRGQ